MQPISIRLYRWAGSWGPFKIRIPCGECTLTRDVLDATLSKELEGIAVDVVVKDWLSCWWEPLSSGGWHAPIVVVDGHVVSQGEVLNRGLLTQAVMVAHAKYSQISGNQFFGKKSCIYCHQAKKILNEARLPYSYHDVVENPRALYEMLARVKLLIGSKAPITVPQIWIDGTYVGGTAQLKTYLKDQGYSS
jgi:glutaredoxin